MLNICLNNYKETDFHEQTNLNVIDMKILFLLFSVRVYFKLPYLDANLVDTSSDFIRFSIRFTELCF